MEQRLIRSPLKKTFNEEFRSVQKKASLHQFFCIHNVLTVNVTLLAHFTQAILCQCATQSGLKPLQTGKTNNPPRSGHPQVRACFRCCVHLVFVDITPTSLW